MDGQQKNLKAEIGRRRTDDDVPCPDREEGHDRTRQRTGHNIAMEATPCDLSFVLQLPSNITDSSVDVHGMDDAEEMTMCVTEGSKKIINGIMHEIYQKDAMARHNKLKADHARSMWQSEVRKGILMQKTLIENEETVKTLQTDLMKSRETETVIRNQLDSITNLLTTITIDRRDTEFDYPLGMSKDAYEKWCRIYQSFIHCLISSDAPDDVINQCESVESDMLNGKVSFEEGLNILKSHGFDAGEYMA